jgi:hypothetical protein
MGIAGQDPQSQGDESRDESVLPVQGAIEQQRTERPGQEQGQGSGGSQNGRQPPREE